MGWTVTKRSPRTSASYLGNHYVEKKQPGPAWTKYQLKTVIDGLHAHGVKAHFSIFPNSRDDFFHKEWLGEHPEAAMAVANSWDRHPIINPLKRLNDGSYYEDFLVRKMVEVCSDYGFDGCHLVDGYNHGWMQLCHGDYSDDMVAQFVEHGGVALPKDVLEACGGDVAKVKARGAWIWGNQRRAWIDFHVDRWERYFRKVVEGVARRRQRGGL